MPLTAANLFLAAVTVSKRVCPAASSSSSRSPSALLPPGPGLSALMNIPVIDAGPVISIPGCFKSSGTGGTVQSSGTCVFSLFVGRD